MMSTVDLFFYFVPTILFEIAIVLLLFKMWWRYRRVISLYRLPTLMIIISVVLKVVYNTVDTMAGIFGWWPVG